MSTETHFADRFFDEIDQASEDENYFSPVLRGLSGYVDVPKARVLDVGCGTGVFMKQLVDCGCSNLYGVDGPSDFAARALERGYRDVAIVDDLNTCRLPYEDREFDLVISKDVFEHLLNPLHALSEIRRVLQPGGHFLFHVPNHFPLTGRLRFVLTNDIDTFSFFDGASRWTFPHVRFYEHGECLRTMASQGFSPVADFSRYFPDLPVVGRFRWGQSLGRGLAAWRPSQMARGITLLMSKNGVET
jgi:SAM-dependent methyltransferase